MPIGIFDPGGPNDQSGFFYVARVIAASIDSVDENVRKRYRLEELDNVNSPSEFLEIIHDQVTAILAHRSPDDLLDDPLCWQYLEDAAGIQCFYLHRSGVAIHLWVFPQVPDNERFAVIDEPFCLRYIDEDIVPDEVWNEFVQSVVSHNK